MHRRPTPHILALTLAFLLGLCAHASAQVPVHAYGYGGVSSGTKSCKTPANTPAQSEAACGSFDPPGV